MHMVIFNIVVLCNLTLMNSNFSIFDVNYYYFINVIVLKIVNV